MYNFNGVYTKYIVFYSLTLTFYTMSRDFLDIYIFIAPVQARYRFFLAKIIITTIFNLRETTGFERKKNYVFRLSFVVFKAWKGVMVNIWLARNLFFLFFCGLLGSPTSPLLVFYGICGYSIAVYYSTWMPSWLPIQLNNECSWRELVFSTWRSRSSKLLFAIWSVSMFFRVENSSHISTTICKNILAQYSGA